MNAASGLLAQIGIGIPARDRWDDLHLTLQKLEEFGLGDNQTIVMDDASRELAPQALRDRFPKVRFERSEIPKSATGQRNYLARLLTTTYFFQIDSDSFPLCGDLSEAASWLGSREDALALALVITDRSNFLEDLKSVPSQPFPCQYFIGCGALIKRELFLELGAYEETLEYFAEEVELALHARTRNLVIYQYPGVVIRHNLSPAARDPNRRGFLIIRNELLLAALHYPFPFLLVRWLQLPIKALICKWVSWHGVSRGWWAALKLLPKVRPKRSAVSNTTFLDWRKLPKPINYH
jgi:GT2 family glycosyltransferase